MDFFKYISDWINGNPGKALGTLLGFLFGILIFTIGPVKTLLILLFIIIGYIIGKSRDEDRSVLDVVAGLFRKRDE